MGKKTDLKENFMQRQTEGKRGGETDFSKGREKETELRQAFLALFCPQFLSQSSAMSENALEGIS